MGWIHQYWQRKRVNREVTEPSWLDLSRARRRTGTDCTSVSRRSHSFEDPGQQNQDCCRRDI